VNFRKINNHLINLDKVNCFVYWYNDSRTCPHAIGVVYDNRKFEAVSEHATKEKALEALEKMSDYLKGV
jgi:hypothetical protein